jgi:hypothetical protein
MAVIPAVFFAVLALGQATVVKECEDFELFE